MKQHACTADRRYRRMMVRALVVFAVALHGGELVASPVASMLQLVSSASDYDEEGSKTPSGEKDRDISEEVLALREGRCAEPQPQSATETSLAALRTFANSPTPRQTTVRLTHRSHELVCLLI